MLLATSIISYTLAMQSIAHPVCVIWKATLRFAYSASRQESKFFEFHFFVVKHASLCLISSTDITKTTFIIILHDSLSPYVANREAIQNRAVLEQFFTNFGQK